MWMIHIIPILLVCIWALFLPLMSRDRRIVRIVSYSCLAYMAFMLVGSVMFEVDGDNYIIETETTVVDGRHYSSPGSDGGAHQVIAGEGQVIVLNREIMRIRNPWMKNVFIFNKDGKVRQTKITVEDEK